MAREPKCWRRPRIVLLMMASAFAIGPGAACAQEARFTSAEPSLLQRSVFVAPNETRFSGTAEVTGVFEVVWESQSDGFAAGTRVVFRPDARSRRVLPHDAAGDPVREIWIRNTGKAIDALLPHGQKRPNPSSRQRALTGSATILITSYRTSVDCDQRDYNALLVSVVRRSREVSRTAPADGDFTC